MTDATRRPRANGATATLPEPESPNEVTMTGNTPVRTTPAMRRPASALSTTTAPGPGVAGLHWSEFPAFVAEHNWTAPAAVYNLVDRFTVDIERLGERRQKTADDAAMAQRLSALEAKAHRLETEAHRPETEVTEMPARRGASEPDAPSGAGERRGRSCRDDPTTCWRA